MSFITDDQAERAIHFLRDNASKLAEAKRKQVLTEAMTKRVKAIETLRSDAKTVSERENAAMASEAYLTAITDEAEAAAEYEKQRALKDAAMATMECWRSLNASARALRAA